MDIPQNRRWMYRRLDANKRWTNEFTEGVHEFLQFAIAQEKFQLQGEKLRCPCNKYKCLVFNFVDEVGYDLYEQGFMPNYYWWTNHGCLGPTKSVPTQLKRLDPKRSSPSQTSLPAKADFSG
ncbi:hypothetical protein CR513_50297, partial [Mucuna pruriens]